MWPSASCKGAKTCWPTVARRSFHLELVRYGLMATVWTGDPARGHRVARAIKSGMVGINMPFTAFPGIPFGGYKQSGFGRELGLETLDLYLETKSVIVSTSPKPINPFGL